MTLACLLAGTAARGGWRARLAKASRTSTPPVGPQCFELTPTVPIPRAAVTLSISVTSKHVASCSRFDRVVQRVSGAAGVVWCGVVWCPDVWCGRVVWCQVPAAAIGVVGTEHDWKLSTQPEPGLTDARLTHHVDLARLLCTCTRVVQELCTCNVANLPCCRLTCARCRYRWRSLRPRGARGRPQPPPPEAGRCCSAAVRAPLHCTHYPHDVNTGDHRNLP